MEAWHGRKALRPGTKIQVGRGGPRVIMQITEPADKIQMTAAEAIAFAQALVRNAMEVDRRIILPGDLGAALPPNLGQRFPFVKK